MNLYLLFSSLIFATALPGCKSPDSGSEPVASYTALNLLSRSESDEVDRLARDLIQKLLIRGTNY